MLEQLDSEPIAMTIGSALHISALAKSVQQAERATFVQRNAFGNLAELQFFRISKALEHVERLQYCLNYILVVCFSR